MNGTRTWWILAAAGALLLAIAACDDSETIAPDGSTITLTANPSQILLQGGVQVGSVQILATVRNSIGVPLPDQDVRFTTTFGELKPPSGTPIPTGDLGNATCDLTNATSGPAITATSGKATASITLNSTTCTISSVLLNPTNVLLPDCQEEIVFTAQVVCQDGTGAENVTVSFDFKDKATTNLTGTFNPGIGTTDANGELETTLTINATDCGARCPGANCTTNIEAKSGSVTSNPATITDNIN